MLKTEAYRGWSLIEDLLEREAQWGKALVQEICVCTYVVELVL